MTRSTPEASYPQGTPSDNSRPVDGQCQIRFRRDGVVSEWGIGCHAGVDDDASIAAHLARWMPDAEFLGCCITRVQDGVVLSDTRQATR